MKRMSGSFAWAALVALALGTAGCATASESMGPPARSVPVKASLAAGLAAGSYAQLEQVRADSAFDGRKIIRSADVALDVDDLDEAGRAVARIAEESGGFVLSSSRNRFNLKVPANGLDDALGRVEALGEVTSRSLSGQDVTAEYLDIEVRLKNAHAARDAYAALMAKATSVEEILKVEQALRETQERIELLEGRRKFLDEHLQLSDLGVSLRETRSPGPLQAVWNGVAWIFGKLWWW